MSLFSEISSAFKVLPKIFFSLIIKIIIYIFFNIQFYSEMCQITKVKLVAYDSLLGSDQWSLILL